MSLTLADVLDLGTVAAARPEVVACPHRLATPVRWVHVSDLLDIAQLLRGGELLLTTGVLLGDDPEVHHRFVDDLAAAGVAGVMLELGRAWPEVPGSLVEAATLADLPLIALHDVTRFVDVTEEVHGAIIALQYELLQKAERVGREFTQLILAGGSAREVVERLAIVVENPVVFEDAAHQMLQRATFRRDAGELFSSWAGHSRSPHRRTDDSSAVELHDGTPGCARVPVVARGETWGWLHVIELDRDLDAIDLVAIDRASAAVGTTLLSGSSAIELGDTARGALLGDILQARYGSGAEVLGRAKALGADFEGRTLFAVELDADLAPYVMRFRLSERDRHALRGSLLRIATQAIDGSAAVAISGLDGDRVVALIGLPSEVPVRAEIDALAARIARATVEIAADLQVTIGVSRPVDPDALRRGFDEASEAVRFAARTAEGGVQYFEDLGFLQLLLRLPDADLARFTEAELAPVLEHDASSSAPLLETLRVYLEQGANKSAAAKLLGIERRSLYHRLDRLRRLLPGDIEDAEYRVRLTLAIRTLEMLRRGRGHA
jgi:purine catabolism regulator